MSTCDQLAHTNMIDILIMDNTLLNINLVKSEIYPWAGQVSKALELDILTRSELLEVMDHCQCRKMYIV